MVVDHPNFVLDDVRRVLVASVLSARRYEPDLDLFSADVYAMNWCLKSILT